MAGLDPRIPLECRRRSNGTQERTSKSMHPCTTKTLHSKLVAAGACLLALTVAAIPAAAQQPIFGLDLLNYVANSEQWPMFGQNQMNTATNSNSSLSAATAAKLASKWTFN